MPRMNPGSADTPYSKADVERLVKDLVPPLVEATVDKAVARLQTTLATDIARGVASALNEQNAKLGIDTTTMAGIREAQRRANAIDDWMAKRAENDLRHQRVDDLLKEFTDEDRAWVRTARRRAESDVRTARETFIRWAIPVMLGALAALVGIWLREGRSTPSAAAIAPVEIRSVVPAPQHTPTGR